MKIFCVERKLSLEDNLLAVRKEKHSSVIVAKPRGLVILALPDTDI